MKTISPLGTFDLHCFLTFWRIRLGFWCQFLEFFQVDDPTHPGSWLGAESASLPNAKLAEAGPCCGLDSSAVLNTRNEFGIDLELNKALQLTVFPCVVLKGGGFSVSSNGTVPVSRSYDKTPETISFKRDARLMLPPRSRRVSRCVLDAFWPPV